MTAPVVDSVLDLVGQTPLIRLRRIPGAGSAAVYGKAEHLNPGGSVKDRICLAMIEQAERDGRLKPGQLVVEPTSGNTGIGLALVCAKKGYDLVLTMPASMSLERRQLLQAYGVTIELTEPERVMEGAIERAEAIVRERGAFMPGQFDNPANPEVHARTTAGEIQGALPRVDAFVAAVGTGGTVSGVGRALKDALVVAVEPDASAVLSGEAPGPSKIQGIGAGFVPSILETDLIDEIVTVSNAAAFSTAREAARTDGVPGGISSGAALKAALEIAKRPDMDGKTIVVILASCAERYLSTALFEEE